MRFSSFSATKDHAIKNEVQKSDSISKGFSHTKIGGFEHRPELNCCLQISKTESCTKSHSQAESNDKEKE